MYDYDAQEQLIVDSFVEVELVGEDAFLKIRETLTRIGVANSSKDTLFQSCHILHKRGRYYICHFKEMFMLDGKPSTFSDEDKGRRNVIAKLLEKWGMVKILNRNADSPLLVGVCMTIVPYADKKKWTLSSKYSIGK